MTAVPSAGARHLQKQLMLMGMHSGLQRRGLAELQETPQLKAKISQVPEQEV